MCASWRTCLVASFVALAALWISSPAQASGFPSDEAARQARDEADLQSAVTAYRFWYPTVSAEAMFHGYRTLQQENVLPILSAGPRHVGFTLNSDTPYTGGPLNLKNGPFVIEIPPGPYAGLANDHHQGWIMDMGISGPDRGKGGRYLLLPPGYQGEIPDDYIVAESPTFLALVAFRALPFDGSLNTALKALQKIKIYPLGFPEDRITYMDISDRPTNGTPLAWEENLMFWEKLHLVIDEEPLLEKYLPMYGILSSLGIEKGAPFAPDERMKSILEKAARIGRDQMLASAFNSDRPDRMAWKDRRWEWVGLVPDDPQFETPLGIDLEARERWFIQAVVTSPAMFRRKVGRGSLYWLGLRDTTDTFVDGGKTYRLTIPQPVPAALFWSVTLYDAQTRSEIQAAQNRSAFRSLIELNGKPVGSSIDLYFGPQAPAGHEDRWIQTIPGRNWFAYFRIYGPLPAAFNGDWKLEDFEQIE